MFPSTTSTSLPQNDFTHRRLLLKTPFYPLHPPTPPPLAPPPDYQLPPSSSVHGGFNANVVTVLTVLLFALVCSLCVNNLIKCVLKCSSMMTRDPDYTITIITQEVASNNGLDKRALRTFPVVKYSKEMKMLEAECVICLLEFEGGDKLRMLPKCNHGFHVRCIDQWLSSHSSCPTCRHSLVDTCQKIIECDDHHQPTSSSPSILGQVTGERISLGVVPLERVDLVRNYRGQNGQSQY